MNRDDQRYITLRVGGRVEREHSIAGELTCLCRPSLAEELRKLYGEHLWVYDALAGQDDSQRLRGRKPVVVGELGAIPVVVKRLSHGGFMANLLKDRFLSSARFANHIPVSIFLADKGVATPAVVFASWRRIAGFYRGEVGFEYIEGRDADHLFFRDEPGAPGREEEAGRIGRFVAKLHRIGFHHRDMNLMNFYFAADGRLLILDLDKSSLGRPIGVREKRSTLDRLERSVRKQGRGSAPEYVETIVNAIRDAYSEPNA